MISCVFKKGLKKDRQYTKPLDFCFWGSISETKTQLIVSTTCVDVEFLYFQHQILPIFIQDFQIRLMTLVLIEHIIYIQQKYLYTAKLQLQGRSQGGPGGSVNPLFVSLF